MTDPDDAEVVAWICNRLKWQVLRNQADTIVDPAWRFGCVASIETHARCVLRGIEPLFSFKEIEATQKRFIEKDAKEQGKS